MAKLTTAYIGLGSNLGDRHNSIETALKMLAEIEQIEVARVSDLIETAPLGGSDQPNYLNAVAEIRTTLSVEDLHKKLADVETALGRVRTEKWSPRIIDLDLLLFGSELINTPDLTVPHPQMHLRSFVLSGLCQLNPELPHPVIKEPISELAARLGGADFVPDHERPQLVSIAGVIGVGKTTLAKKLSNSLHSKLLLEPYDKNPFLPEVYAGKKELALDSQLYFLNSRIEQLNLHAFPAGQTTVSDYIFDKELIYARRLLNPQQLTSYERSYQPAAAKVATPVLVIYLYDSAKKCLDRIHTRNRPYEQVIEPQFLEQLAADYERLFADWKLCPVIRISMSNFDCTRNGDIEHLTNQITSYVAV
jgi:2-amino-4-hydroxy-6-hydroxymethyldihydropteridine diphosphokinase